MSSTVAGTRFTERRRREAVHDAVVFLADRYALDPDQRRALTSVPIRWRRGGGRSTFRAPRDGSPGSITVSLPRGSWVRWHVYRRVGAGLVTPREGLRVDLPTLARLVLVHELTHAIQHGACGGPRRRYSEVETTRNEIEFLRRWVPEAHAGLLPVARSPRVRSRRRGGRDRPASSWLDRLFEWLRGPTSARAPGSPAGRALRPAPAG